jgi:hypothetical protein
MHQQQLIGSDPHKDQDATDRQQDDPPDLCTCKPALAILYIGKL